VRWNSPEKFQYLYNIDDISGAFGFVATLPLGNAVIFISSTDTPRAKGFTLISKGLHCWRPLKSFLVQLRSGSYKKARRHCRIFTDYLPALTPNSLAVTLLH